MQTISAGEGKCFPWSGHFAGDEITPVDDDGEPIFAGVRSCGNNDCCNPQHVIGYEKG